MDDWQSWAAPAVVILTALILMAKWLSKKSTGCGNDCECSVKTKPKLP